MQDQSGHFHGNISEKTALRREILTMRDALSPAQRKKKSAIIVRSLMDHSNYKRAGHPMFYASFRSEVSTLELIKNRIKNGLPVILPKTNVEERSIQPYAIHSWDRDVQIGAYGIIEPHPSHAKPVLPEELDLIIVPGSVFDKACTRHGYGGGFYDRFLSMDAPQAFRIGLAFSCQIVEMAPSEIHDQKMDVIIHEAGIIKCQDHT